MNTNLTLPITYARMMAYQASRNLPIQAYPVNEESGEWQLRVTVDGVVRSLTLFESEPEWSDFNTKWIQTDLYDKDIESEEVRFDSPDFVRKHTWDTRWSGRYAKDVPGAAEYIDGVGDEWKWLDSQGNRLVYLDTTTYPAIWKLDDGSEYAKYFPADTNFTPTTLDPVDPEGAWKRKDGNGDWTVDITSPEWKIWPYDGYKLALAKFKCDVDPTAALNNELRYQFYSVLDPTTAQALGLPEPGVGYYDGYYVVQGVPTFLWATLAQQLSLPEPQGGYYTGVYKVKDFKYDSFRQFQRNANYKEPGGSIVFDYDETKRVVIDSKLLQYVIVTMTGAARVTDSAYAKATAIAMKVKSV